MKVKIFYPSGNVLHISGEWQGPAKIDGGCVVLIGVDKDCLVPGDNIIPADALFVGDPRGVYQDEHTDRILYNPREAMQGMDQWILDWLTEHIEWPSILELANDP